MNFGVAKSVGYYDLFNEADETIHIFSISDARTFTLINISVLSLPFSRSFSIAPECLNRIPCIIFVIDKIQSHLLSIASYGRYFFRSEFIELKNGLIAGFQIKALGRNG